MTSETHDALALIESARIDPRSVLRRSEQLLAGDLADAVRSIVSRAAGLAARSSATLDDSIRHLETSVDSATRAGDPELVAEARLSLAGSRAIAGDLHGALSSLEDRPSGLSTNLERRYEFQRATVLARTGSGRTALEIYDDLRPGFRADDDRYFTALTLMNSGRIRLELADIDGASTDLEEAHAIYVSDGSDVAAAYVLHNLGELSLMKGDVCEALERLQVSRDELERLTSTPWEPEVTRGEALLEAGLFEEADRLAESLVDLMGDSGLGLDRAEALLLLSRAQLGLGKRAEAQASAMAAEREFESQGRARWRTQARLAGLRAEPDGGDPSAIERRANTLADELIASGLVAQATEALAEGVVRTSSSGPDCAAALRERLRQLPHGTRIEQRMFVAYADAFHRAAAGDRVGAFRAIRSAVQLSQRHRRSLGATELRMSGSRHASSLAHLALRLALDSRDHRTVFRYSELDRAVSLRSPSVRRPRRPDDQHAIAEIRALARSVDGAPPADAPAAERRLRRAARRFQESERRRPADADAVTTRAPRLSQLRGSLARKQFVSMFVVDDRLHAQVIDAQQTRLVELGAVDDWSVAFERMASVASFAAQGVHRHESKLDRAAEALDAQLASSLRSAIELVLAPPPELLDAPWTMLPSCRTRPVTIVPSASIALRATRLLPARPRVAVGAGPGLRHAHAEAAAVEDVWSPGALGRPKTMSTEVLAELERADIAHLVCHGRHRRGNPLMSELSFDDGPLLVADIERVASVAPLIVLSACHGSASQTYGAETMGVVTALLGAGAACVVAGVGLVPDDSSTAALMVTLHERLRSGASVAHALHAAQSEHVRAAGSVYQCYGSEAMITRA